MGRLRLGDVFSPPGLVSLVRVPLAMAFPFSLHTPTAAVAILVAAGLSDILDGWYARRTGRTTVTGAMLDPVMDKLFVASVAITLLIAGRLSVPLVLLLGARDILELPLVAWIAVDAKNFAERRERVKANIAGKAVTVIQFATVGAALLAERYVFALALASAVSGLVAAATYWARLLSRDTRNAGARSTLRG
jgi:phosphatidylglycerophosphate synthase